MHDSDVVNGVIFRRVQFDETMLHAAVSSGNVELCRWLLDVVRVDINATDVVRPVHRASAAVVANGEP